MDRIIRFSDMTKVEYFDAYDINENKLGFQIMRGNAVPKGCYHMVVEIFTVTKTGKVLTTKRHPNKHFPLYYEVTAGSVLAGEDSLEAAVRELAEETGIQVPTSQLIFLGGGINKDVIYKDYLAVIEEEVEITLQEGETIGYQYVPLESFADFMESVSFVPPAKKKFSYFKDKISSAIQRPIQN